MANSSHSRVSSGVFLTGTLVAIAAVGIISGVSSGVFLAVTLVAIAAVWIISGVIVNVALKSVLMALRYYGQVISYSSTPLLCEEITLVKRLRAQS